VSAPVPRLRAPRRTIRLRLTILYGALFLASAAALVAITYVLLAHRMSAPILQGPVQGEPSIAFSSSTPTLVPGEAPTHVPVDPRRDQVAADLNQFLLQSILSLGIMAVVSVGLGWFVAGRVLRPMRAMTAATRQISEHNLHERLAVAGPPDELKDLGDTIDGLLARLDGAFDAQRRFVANASHELRTPLTVSRAMLEVALADPALDLASLRSICEEVLAAQEHQEQLVEALLTLARSQRGIDRREPVDLGHLVSEVLRARQPVAAARGLKVDVSLVPALVSGDRRLVERLASNLVDNAIGHNVPYGHLEVAVGTRPGHVVLRVANSGPVVPDDQVDRLLQPFQRLESGPAAGQDGLGLGLSIVAAVAAAHDASLGARPRPEGGLDVEVRFPSPRRPVRARAASLTWMRG
jgi:signal transduction histidine kinase